MIVDRKNTRILLIDDSDIIQKTYKEYLIDQGFQDIHQCQTGKQGIEEYKNSLSQKSPFELVVLDYHLPDINGDLVLEEIRSTEKENALQKGAYVIVVTTETNQHVPLDMLDRGADDYLMKPIMKDSFKSAIDHYLDSKQSS